MTDGERQLFVDASVWISLSAVDSEDLLAELDGRVNIPVTVAEEIETDPGATALRNAPDDWLITEPILKTRRILDETEEIVQRAASHLSVEQTDEFSGDVALLALAMRSSNPVVITDNKPLRDTCKALSIPVSGSIGVLIRAVERDAIEPAQAKAKLYAMDEAGARLSASLVKRAERLIDDAAN